MGGVLKSLLPAAANFIPGVGPLVSAGLGAVLNGGGGGGGGNPYAALTSTLGPVEAAAAAKQNANEAKNVQNQSLVQDTSTTNNAIDQITKLIAGLQSQNPLTQDAYGNIAGVQNPNDFSFVNPQTVGSLVPQKQGEVPTVAPQGPAPNSYMAAVGKNMGQTAPPVPATTASGANNLAIEKAQQPAAPAPAATAPAAATGWTPQQQAAIQAAVTSSLGGIQGGETVGQIGSLAQDALSKSGLFSPAQAAALGKAAQWDSHGAGFREQGSDVTPFYQAELGAINSGYTGPYGSPAPGQPAAAQAPPPAAPAAARPAPVVAPAPAPVAAPRMTQPVQRAMPAQRQIMGY